jgi:hypothetical protein
MASEARRIPSMFANARNVRNDRILLVGVGVLLVVYLLATGVLLTGL